MVLSSSALPSSAGSQTTPLQHPHLAIIELMPNLSLQRCEALRCDKVDPVHVQAARVVAGLSFSNDYFIM